MLKKLAMIFGIVFVLIGILGFVPGITTTDDQGMMMLLGIFGVDMVHNIVHILAGVLGLAASMSDMYAKWYFLGFGAVYGLVALLGMMDGSSVLGLFDVNAADNWLHIGLAVIMIGIGLLVKPGMAMMGKSGGSATPMAT